MLRLPRGVPRMGMLLFFTPQKAAKPRPEQKPGATASIIIFPGVRYERPKPFDRMGSMLARPKPGPVQY